LGVFAILMNVRTMGFVRGLLPPLGVTNGQERSSGLGARLFQEFYRAYYASGLGRAPSVPQGGSGWPRARLFHPALLSSPLLSAQEYSEQYYTRFLYCT
jgi:hypothetical protein